MRRSLLFVLALLPVCLLAACRDAPPEPPREDRILTLLYWQAPTLPGPYLASGFKDMDAGAVTLEPLASYDPDGNLVPRLAVDIPTIANGGVAADQTSITWTLREGLKWSDGSDMTARDVVFTWRYCTHAETGCTNASAFAGIASVQAVDERTVEIRFEAPTPYPYSAFVGGGTPIISATQFADCVGAAARGCHAQNTAPLGTGPYRIVEFTPNDRAVYERNPHYRGEAPYFDRVVLRGGGDALSAARAVLEAGEADFAWNVQVEPEQLAAMEEAGLGEVVVAFAGIVERIVVNQTNPDPALGDDRSDYLDGANPHPFLTFTPIAQAMSMAIDAPSSPITSTASPAGPRATSSRRPRATPRTRMRTASCRTSRGPSGCSTSTASWTATATACASTRACRCGSATRRRSTPCGRRRSC